MELLEEPQGARMVAQPLAHDAEVIDGLGAVRLRPHALLVRGRVRVRGRGRVRVSLRPHALLVRVRGRVRVRVSLRPHALL